MSGRPKGSSYLLDTSHFYLNFYFFSNLTGAKTLHLCFLRYSPLELIDLIDSIQAGMFGMVLERIVIPDIRKISGVTDKKIAAVGVTKILCECEPIFNGSYSKYW